MNATGLAKSVVGIGEALFDMLPTGATLGGAPLNVMIQLHQLAGDRNIQARLASRVGQDPLGDNLLQQLRERGLDTNLIQLDPDRATGQVFVDLDANGSPTYEIVRDVAWDVMQWDYDIEDAAQRCDAICFGSLAQRDGQTRNTIYRCLQLASRAVRLFDVNLREPFVDQQHIRRSCELANLIKLNEHELTRIADYLGLDPADNEQEAEQVLPERMLEALPHVQMIALTRGKRGTRLITRDGAYDGESVEYPRQENADSVGAGDATCAAILAGRLLRKPPQKIADLANHMGGYVASQHGGTPPLPDNIRAMLDA